MQNPLHGYITRNDLPGPSLRTWERIFARGEGPRAVKISGRYYYHRDDVAVWLAERGYLGPEERAQRYEPVGLIEAALRRELDQLREEIVAELRRGE